MEIEKSVIEGCIKKDRKAEYDLFKLCYSYLLSICLRYTRNMDLAKETLNMGFYKVLSNIKKYDSSMPFKPWARRIMINTLINEYKKQKQLNENILYVENYIEEQDYSEINEAVTKADTETIFSCISKLPPASAQVFNLYIIDGYKHSEIAEMLSISEGTSKWHLNSAKEKLKVMLTEGEVKINNHPDSYREKKIAVNE